jgi:hypothetical protein
VFVLLEFVVVHCFFIIDIFLKRDECFESFFLNLKSKKVENKFLIKRLKLEIIKIYFYVQHTTLCF